MMPDTQKQSANGKIRLLLHMCCGPCSLAPVMYLREEGFDLSGLFYNPNIHPLMEYLRRRESAIKAAQQLDLPIFLPDTKEENSWNIANWLTAVHDPKRVVLGPTSTKRCDFCYEERLFFTARMAKSLGFNAFCTSLLYSKRQRHEAIRLAGEKISAEIGITFIYRDFRNFWQEGIDMSLDLSLYRQNYCGCIYSEAERFSKKLEKLRAKNEHNLLENIVL